ANNTANITIANSSDDFYGKSEKLALTLVGLLLFWLLLFIVVCVVLHCLKVRKRKKENNFCKTNNAKNVDGHEVGVLAQKSQALFKLDLHQTHQHQRCSEHFQPYFHRKHLQQQQQQQQQRHKRSNSNGQSEFFYFSHKQHRHSSNFYNHHQNSSGHHNNNATNSSFATTATTPNDDITDETCLILSPTSPSTQIYSPTTHTSNIFSPSSTPCTMTPSTPLPCISTDTSWLPEDFKINTNTMNSANNSSANIVNNVNSMKQKNSMNMTNHISNANNYDTKVQINIGNTYCNSSDSSINKMTLHACKSFNKQNYTNKLLDSINNNNSSHDDNKNYFNVTRGINIRKDNNNNSSRVEEKICMANQDGIVRLNDANFQKMTNSTLIQRKTDPDDDDDNNDDDNRANDDDYNFGQYVEDEKIKSTTNFRKKQYNENLARSSEKSCKNFAKKGRNYKNAISNKNINNNLNNNLNHNINSNTTNANNTTTNTNINANVNNNINNNLDQNTMDDRDVINTNRIVGNSLGGREINQKNNNDNAANVNCSHCEDGEDDDGGDEDNDDSDGDCDYINIQAIEDDDDDDDDDEGGMFSTKSARHQQQLFNNSNVEHFNERQINKTLGGSFEKKYTNVHDGVESIINNNNKNNNNNKDVSIYTNNNINSRNSICTSKIFSHLQICYDSFSPEVETPFSGSKKSKLTMTSPEISSSGFSDWNGNVNIDCVKYDANVLKKSYSNEDESDGEDENDEESYAGWDDYDENKNLDSEMKLNSLDSKHVPGFPHFQGQRSQQSCQHSQNFQQGQKKFLFSEFLLPKSGSMNQSDASKLEKKKLKFTNYYNILFLNNDKSKKSLKTQNRTSTASTASCSNPATSSVPTTSTTHPSSTTRSLVSRKTPNMGSSISLHRRLTHATSNNNISNVNNNISNDNNNNDVVNNNISVESNSLSKSKNETDMNSCDGITDQLSNNICNQTNLHETSNSISTIENSFNVTPYETNFSKVHLIADNNDDLESYNLGSGLKTVNTSNLAKTDADFTQNLRQIHEQPLLLHPQRFLQLQISQQQQQQRNIISLPSKIKQISLNGTITDSNDAKLFGNQTIPHQQQIQQQKHQRYSLPNQIDQQPFKNQLQHHQDQHQHAQMPSLQDSQTVLFHKPPLKPQHHQLNLQNPMLQKDQQQNQQSQQLLQKPKLKSLTLLKFQQQQHQLHQKFQPNQQQQQQQQHMLPSPSLEKPRQPIMGQTRLADRHRTDIASTNIFWSPQINHNSCNDISRNSNKSNFNFCNNSNAAEDVVFADNANKTMQRPDDGQHIYERLNHFRLSQPLDHHQSQQQFNFNQPDRNSAFQLDNNISLHNINSSSPTLLRHNNTSRECKSDLLQRRALNIHNNNNNHNSNRHNKNINSNYTINHITNNNKTSNNNVRQNCLTIDSTKIIPNVKQNFVEKSREDRTTENVWRPKDLYSINTNDYMCNNESSKLAEQGVGLETCGKYNV
ncbi:hypothetical protein HELRODRAFT_180450, partial [Helobdella robusta]|uniref:Uncharacterized protein n=1 Tax=Helobdella robusta TaxID=6412 RepID=T1FFX8_HELRO